MIYEYKQLVPVLFGEGCIRMLGEKAAAAGCKKVLLVYDRVMKDMGTADKAEQSLQRAGVAVVPFDGVEPDAPIGVVNAGGDLARENAVDGVVAVGGGSCLDAAKAMAALVSHAPPIEQYLSVPPSTLELTIPTFLVPTTAGTGSEVTFASVISNTRKGAKMGLFVTYQPRSYAIIDPELAVSAPPSVTAYAGLDALSHSVEAITAKNRNPRSELLAVGAIRLVAGWLPIAVENGANVEARANMCLAANWAGLAFADTDVQLGHDIADAISSACHTPHGLNCGWTTPEMIRLYGETLPREIRAIGEALGLSFTGREAPAQVADEAAEAVRMLMRRAGVKSMKGMGFTREQVLSAKDVAFTSPLKYNSPLDVTSEMCATLLGNMYDNYQ